MTGVPYPPSVSEPDPRPRTTWRRLGTGFLALVVASLLLPSVAAVGVSLPSRSDPGTLAVSVPPGIFPGTHAASVGVPSAGSGYVAATVFPPPDPVARDRAIQASTSVTLRPAVVHPTVGAPSPTGTLFPSNGTIDKGLVGASNIAYPLGIAYDPVDHHPLVAGAYSATLGDVNPTTGSVSSIATLGSSTTSPYVLGAQATAVAFDSTSGLAYVLDPLGGFVDVVDVANGTTVALFELSLFGSTPSAVALDPTDGYLFVADSANDSVDFLDDTSGAILINITVGVDPVALAYDSASAELFVANAGSNNVSVISVPSEMAVASVPVGTEPIALADVTSTHTLWVLNSRSGNVTFVDEATLSSPGTVYLPTGSIGYATGLVVDPARNRVYALNAPSGDVQQLNATTGALGTSATVGGTVYAGALDASRDQVDLANTARNTLDVLDPATGSVVGSYPLGSAPMGAVYDPSTETTFVADAATDWVDVYDAKTEAPLAPIPIGAPAVGIVYAASVNLVAVIQSDGNVSFISPSTGGVSGTWGPHNGTILNQIAFANGNFFITGFNPYRPSDPWDVYVVSPSFSELRCIGAGYGVTALTYDSSTHNLYVAASDEIVIISAAVNNYEGAVSIPSATVASGVAFDADTSSVIVATALPGTVLAYNTSSAHWTGDAVDGGLDSDFSSVLYVSSLRTIYVTELFNGVLIALQETASSTFVNASATAGTGPVGTAFSTLSGLLYVSNMVGGTISLDQVGPATSLPLVASLSASPASVALGSPVVFTTSVTFPSWDKNLTYSGLPSGCTGRNATVLTCTPSAAGSFPVTVTVRNPLGQTTTASTTVAVIAPLVLGSVAAVPAAVTLGTSTRIEVQYSGGAPPVAVSYPELPTGCANTSSVNWSCTPTATGTFPIEVEINDSVGHSVNGTAELTVNPHLAITSFGTSNGNISLGGSVTFTVVVTGGTTPLSYSYTGLPAGCSSENAATFSCSPSAIGVFPVGVTVTDASGTKAIDSTTLAVASTGSGTGTGGFTSLDLLVVLAAVVLVGVVGVLFATRRRRPAAGGPMVAAGGAAPPAGPTEEEEEEPEAPEGSVIVEPPPREEVMAAAPPPPPVKAPERFFTDPDAEPAPPPAAPAPGAGRPPLICAKCGTANEPWLTTCRKCKRALLSTGSS